MARRTRNQTSTDPQAEVAPAEAQAAPAQETLPPATRPQRQPRSPNKNSTVGRGGSKRGGQSSETRRLVEALLRNRGIRGASQDELEQVVRWAESIRSEGAAIEAEATDLRKLGPRSGTARGTTTAAAATRRKQERQSKLQELDTRRQRQTMNQALLEGILAGGVSLDVQEGGELRFLHAQGHAATDVAGPATA